MNKLITLSLVAVLGLLLLGGYLSMNPHHLPQFIRGLVPGGEVPQPKSPMQNFRPPQFGLGQ
jgi:hypothetical protein